MPRNMRLLLVLVLGAALAGCATPSGGSGSGLAKESSTDKRSEAARVRVELGQRYMQQGKLELAQENLQKALEYDANYVDAHTVLGVLMERIGHTREAGEHYLRAAELAPKSGATNNNYGQFLCASGRYAEAQKYFTRAMEDPFYKTPDVLYTNAGSCLLTGGGQAEQAEADFRRALEANPNNALALYSMARVLYLKNDYFHARAFVQRFEALGQPSPDALLLARDIETKLGHAEGAREYSQRLREQFPDTPQAHSLDAAATPR